MFDFFKRRENEQQQQPQPTQQPVQSFVVDECRHNVVMALLQGSQYFAVYIAPNATATGSDVKTISRIDRQALMLGLKALAAQNRTFAEDLLNLVIDINTQNGTKTPAERKME